MAEFVTRRMEDKIQFLELLKLTELFKPEEIGEIVSDFNNHEYKIQRMERTLDDVLQYVEFQVSFLDLIRARRQKTNYYHKADQIEGVIRSQINSLFGVAAQKFHDRLEFWSARINFAKSQKWPTAVRKNFEDVTRKLGKQYPQLWIEASKYEWSLKPPRNIDAARKILQLGLRDHPNSEALFITAFRLELEYVNILETKPKLLDEVLTQDSGDAIVNKLALAKVIYKSAKKNSKKSEKFYLKFYLALSDVNPVKTKGLLEEINADAEEFMSSLPTGQELEKDIKLLEIEGNVKTQLQNFELFLSTLSDVKSLLKTAETIEDSKFWTTIFFTLSQKKNLNVKMNDWFDLCMIPKCKDVILQLRLWVLNYYSLEYQSALNKARKWYKKVQAIYPTSQQIHLALVELEMNTGKPSFVKIREIFDRTIFLFGKDSAEPWLRYLKFEKTHGTRDNNYSIIYSRALRELQPDFQEEFRIELLNN